MALRSEALSDTRFGARVASPTRAPIADPHDGLPGWALAGLIAAVFGGVCALTYLHAAGAW